MGGANAGFSQQVRVRPGPRPQPGNTVSLTVEAALPDLVLLALINVASTNDAARNERSVVL